MGRFALPVHKRPQRFRKSIGSINYGAGSLQNIAGGVPKTGYISGLDLESLIVVTCGGTAPVIAGYGGYGPYQLLGIQVGARQPIAMPGFHLEKFYEQFDAPYIDAMTTQPVVISSANNWTPHLRLPFTVSPDSEIGAWYAGDQTLQLNAFVTGNPATSVFSTVNAATIAGSYTVWVERFSAPAPDEPGGWLSEISFLDEKKLYGSFALKNGETLIALDLDRDYLEIMLIFYTGSTNDSTFTPANGLYSAITLQVDDTIPLYDRIDEAALRFEMLQHYVRQSAPPTGVAMLDFMFKDDSQSRRDVLPTDTDTTHSLNLRIVSNSTANTVDVVTHTVTDNPFAKKWVDAAKAHKAAAAKAHAGRR
jgi:hypothetical protein